jgi:hypothetical protein
MSNDSELFIGQPLAGEMSRGSLVPLYEAKMVHHYDHRYGTYEGQTEAQASQGILPKMTIQQHSNSWIFPTPRYWVQASAVNHRLESQWHRPWVFGWRRSSRSGDYRSIIASVVPRVGIGDSFFLMFFDELFRRQGPGLIASMQSLILDYTARQKLGGTNCSFYIIKQLPVPPPSAYDAPTPWHRSTSLAEWILPRVLELTYTAWDLVGFARDHGYDGPPYRWDEERRFWLRAELDAAYFHLYGLAPDEVDHVMESFWLVRQRDEKAHDSYRTKVAILDLYQRMADAAAKSSEYQTVLDPPPADPSIAHPPLTPEQAEQLAPILARALAAPLSEPAQADPAPKPKPKPKSKPSKPLAPAEPPPIDDGPLFSRPVDYAAAANAAPTSIAADAPALTPDMSAVLQALRHANAPLTQPELLTTTGLDAKRWKSALDALLDLGLVAKTGRGRGVKYLSVK